MPKAENAETSSSNSKRAYRKGNPLSPSERQRALIARKKNTHKEIRVLVENEYKTTLQRLCEHDGLTQSEMIEKLIKAEGCRLENNVTE